jgi:hypothetical protein
MKHGFLFGTLCYLCGPVEHNKDVTWRDRINTEFGIRYINPIRKPAWAPQESINLVALGDVFNNQIAANTAIYDRKLCLQQVVVSDWIICYIPENKPFTCGTIEELVLAHHINKPVFFVYNNGCPSTWLYSMFPELDIWFKSFDDLYIKLHMINNGEIRLDPVKWLSIFYREINGQTHHPQWVEQKIT